MQSPLSREAMLALSRRGSIKCHDLQNPTFDTFSGKISNEIEETKATDKFPFFPGLLLSVVPLALLAIQLFWQVGILDLGSWHLSCILHLYLQQIECNPEN